MRILFVAPNLDVGGVERQWSILVSALANRGVAATVFTLDGKGRFFEELAANGVPVHCFALHGQLRAATKAMSGIVDHRPDVIMTAGVSALVVGYFASRRVRAPLVAANHSIPEHPMSGRQRVVLRMLAPRVRVCTAVSHAQEPFLASLGFKADAVRVIPNGVDVVGARRSREEVRTKLGVGEDGFVALLIATLRPEKRVDRFIDAIAAAKCTTPRITGFVVGGGPELADVRRRCADQGDAVTALGARVDVPELIHAADVVCLTSDAEALPMSILEAMALGRPVVSTDVGGVRDAVVHGETGFLFQPDDIEGFVGLVRALANDAGLASRLGAAGRGRHRELFTTDRMVGAHMKLFEEMTRQQSGPDLDARPSDPLVQW